VRRGTGRHALRCGCDDAVGEDARVRDAGGSMLRAAGSTPEQESTRSMLEQPLTTRPDVAPISDDPGRIDHSMDALQYGIAFLAIIVAVLLAAFR
jgi:hypothetical protein